MSTPYDQPINYYYCLPLPDLEPHRISCQRLRRFEDGDALCNGKLILFLNPLQGKNPQRPQAECPARGVPEAQIRRAGRWNTDAMTGAYLSYLRAARPFYRGDEGRGSNAVLAYATDQEQWQDKPV
jgi:hypothetical protein